VIRLGFTGTDTGVGKTLVGCGIAAALVRRGLRVTALKPIETGVAANDVTRDGARLARAAGDGRPLALLAPLTLGDPVAPLVAARRAGVTIDLDALDHAIRSAEVDTDVLIVEGAGGLLVPITERVSFDALFARWSLELIVVAANRLGVINHVRLTCVAARAAGLAIRAVVLNRVTPGDADASVLDNAKVIAELENVRVVELPCTPHPDDLDVVADVCERSGLADVAARFPRPYYRDRPTELECARRSSARRRRHPRDDALAVLDAPDDALLTNRRSHRVRRHHLGTVFACTFAQRAERCVGGLSLLPQSSVSTAESRAPFMARERFSRRPTGSESECRNVLHGDTGASPGGRVFEKVLAGPRR
jgi:dethiobiotin synthetase